MGQNFPELLRQVVLVHTVRLTLIPVAAATPVPALLVDVEVTKEGAAGAALSLDVAWVETGTT